MIIVGDFKVDLLEACKDTDAMANDMTTNRVASSTETFINHVYIRTSLSATTHIILFDISDHFLTLTSFLQHKITNKTNTVTKSWLAADYYANIKLSLSEEDGSPMEQLGINDATSFLMNNINEIMAFSPAETKETTLALLG